MICKESVFLVFLIFVIFHKVIEGFARANIESDQQVIIAMFFYEVAYLVSVPLLLGLFSGSCS